MGGTGKEAGEDLLGESADTLHPEETASVASLCKSPLRSEPFYCHPVIMAEGHSPLNEAQSSRVIVHNTERPMREGWWGKWHHVKQARKGKYGRKMISNVTLLLQQAAVTFDFRSTLWMTLLNLLCSQTLIVENIHYYLWLPFIFS